MLSFQCLWVRARCGHESRRDSFQQTKGPVRMLGWEDNATKDAIFAKHSKGIFGIYCRYTCINIHKYKYNIYIYMYVVGQHPFHKCSIVSHSYGFLSSWPKKWVDSLARWKQISTTTNRVPRQWWQRAKWRSHTTWLSCFMLPGNMALRLWMYMLPQDPMYIEDLIGIGWWILHRVLSKTHPSPIWCWRDLWGSQELLSIWQMYTSQIMLRVYDRNRGALYTYSPEI